jgi:hypothetical protein
MAEWQRWNGARSSVSVQMIFRVVLFDSRVAVGDRTVAVRGAKQSDVARFATAASSRVFGPDEPVCRVQWRASDH